MQNGAILLKTQFCTEHLQWQCQVKYPDKHKAPLQLNSDSSPEGGSPQHFPSFKGVPLRRGRTAPHHSEELEEEKFSELLKTSGCFRKQVPHLTWDHLSPSWRSRHRGSGALNSVKLQVETICSGLEVRQTRQHRTLQNKTEYYCPWLWRALPKCALCFHKQHFTKHSPCIRKKQELLTQENVTFSVFGGTETAAEVPHLPDNYVIGWDLKKDI